MKKREAILSELQTVCEQGGGVLKAEAVIAFAEDETTALHGQFVWDDTKAANSYRLEQARRLIRVHVAVLKEDTSPFRVFCSLPNDRRLKGGGYRETTTVLKVQSQRDELLAEARRELEHFERKYEVLAEELAPVFLAIREVVAQSTPELAAAGT